MTPDSPEIARLRQVQDEKDRVFPHHVYVGVERADLRYALRLIDDSCLGCAMVDELRKQGQRLDRMYALFDEVMRQHRGERPLLTPDQCREIEAASGVMDLRTYQQETCACADIWTDFGIGE